MYYLLSENIKTMPLISCAFFFINAKSRISHDAAHMCQGKSNIRASMSELFYDHTILNVRAVIDCYTILALFCEKLSLASSDHAKHKPGGTAIEDFCFLLFVLKLNVPVNNFSVMLRWSHRFLDITSNFGE